MCIKVYFHQHRPSTNASFRKENELKMIANMRWLHFCEYKIIMVKWQYFSAFCYFMNLSTSKIVRQSTACCNDLWLFNNGTGDIVVLSYDIGYRAKKQKGLL